MDFDKLEIPVYNGVAIQNGAFQNRLAPISVRPGDSMLIDSKSPKGTDLGILKKTRSTSMQNERNVGRDELERLVMTYLEASRYLWKCPSYNENELDNVCNILSTNELGAPEPELVARMKEQASQIGYIRFRTFHSQILGEVVGNIVNMLQDDYPDARTEQFAKEVTSEIDGLIAEIES